jgi:hypothetical protein
LRFWQSGWRHLSVAVESPPDKRRWIGRPCNGQELCVMAIAAR